jgi:hypothetical protein
MKMTYGRRLAALLILMSAGSSSATAENSVSTDTPKPAAKPPAHAAQKPKAVAQPKKPDISDAEKKPASTTIPMDFSYIKKPEDARSDTPAKSDDSRFMKPDLNSQGNGSLSPGMKFSW